MHLPSKAVSVKGDGVSAYYPCNTCGGKATREVNHKLKIWYCHKCGIGGREKSSEAYKSGAMDQESEKWEDTFHEAGPRSILRQYLKVRGLTPKLIRDLKPHWGPNLFRVYFPLYLPWNPEPQYFVGRGIFETVTPKYVNPPMKMFKRRRNELVWGMHRFKTPVKELIVCEGILDAVWGKNRVALLGMTMNDAQRDLLLQMVTKEIIVMLDGGEEKAASRIVERIASSWSGRVSIVHLPPRTDPGDLRGNDSKWIKERERVL